jgi:hypothetical protein
MKIMRHEETIAPNDLAHSLGSASGGKDEVFGSPTAITLQFTRGTIHSLLGGSDGMDWGHESFHNAKVVMSDLGQGGYAVDGAGDISDNLQGVVILLMVHTHHKCGGISRRDRDYDPFGSMLQVSPSLPHSSEDTSGLHDVLSTSITWKMGMAFLLMTSFPSSAFTVTLNLPWVESYWNM